MNKWRSEFFNKNNDDTNSIKTFISKAKSLAPKSAQVKIKHKWLMQTSDFTRAFLFGCITSLL